MFSVGKGSGSVPSVAKVRVKLEALPASLVTKAASSYAVEVVILAPFSSAFCLIGSLCFFVEANGLAASLWAGRGNTIGDRAIIGFFAT